VEEEAAQEFIDGQGHEPLPVGVSGISPAEGDVAVGEGNESVVGDGDAVGVGTEIGVTTPKAKIVRLGLLRKPIAFRKPIAIPLSNAKYGAFLKLEHRCNNLPLRNPKRLPSGRPITPTSENAT
jgi:hypothetical protein